MTFSKQLLPLVYIFLFFFFLPLLYASEPKCYYTYSCEGANAAPLASSSFKSKESISKNGLFSFILRLLKLVCLTLITLVIAITSFVAYLMVSSERLNRDIRRLGVQLITRENRDIQQGLDVQLTAGEPCIRHPRVVSSIEEVYKKVELEENLKAPGRNDVLCPICRAEYASDETVVCLLECEHCFHIQCIDAWLQLHSSCPTCRHQVPTLRQVCY